MKKIPTIFDRDWEGTPSRVVDKPSTLCGWVFAGEGVATQKLDGTCCLVRDNRLYKRYEVKPGKFPPNGFVWADDDAETGKTVGWLPVGDGPEDRWHREAWTAIGCDAPDNTYELIGPKIQSNPEGAPEHKLVSHGETGVWHDAPRTFDGLREWLADKNMEGLVFHHPDGRMAKIKLRDFGLKRPIKP